MIIRLPETYDTDSAEVKDKTLFVNKNISYEKLMYDVTYKLKGEQKCLYCGKPLNDKNRTMDHMYPRRWGGISIPDNLVPCCQQCNQLKRDMTYKQFSIWLSLNTPSERMLFYKKCEHQNIQLAKEGNFILNPDWLDDCNVSELLSKVFYFDINNEKMDKLSEYYEFWGQYPHPVIVSKNGFIFKGVHSLYHAKSIYKESVKTIVLENVVKID